jgi:hypothetical protein
MFRRVLAIAVFLICSLCSAADAQTRTFVRYGGYIAQKIKQFP